MATTKKVLELEIDVDSGDVKKLDADLNKIIGTKKELNNQQEAQNETTNNAVGLIDKFTGGLASSAQGWFKMGKSAATALTGMKAGLISTGIGALVVGLGLVVAYWDEIVDFIGDGDDEMQNLIDSQEAYNKELQKSEDLNKKVSAALKRNGASELDQLKNRIKQQKELTAIADKASREAFKTFDKLVQERKKLSKLEKFVGLGVSEEDITKAKEIFDESFKVYEEYNENVKDLIFQQKELEKKLQEEVTEKTEAEQEKRIDLTKKYLDLKLSLEQAHSLSLIEDDRERQLKALEFELENNRRSIEESEFTEKQKRALKESYEIQWLDKKTQLEDEWRAADQLKIDEAEKLKQDRLDAALKAQGDSEIQAEQEYRNQLSELQDEAFEKLLSDQDWEIRMVQEKYFTLIEQAELYGEDKAAIEEMQAAEIQEINDRAAKKKKEDEKAAADATVAVATATIGSLSALNQAFSKDDEKGRREAFKREKALGIASAVINTAKSAVSAYNSMAGIPFVGPVLAPIAAAAAIAAGAAQIKNITKQKYKGESGGGDGGAASGLTASGGGSAPSAPQFNTVGTSGFNQINESLNNNNRNPTKAYVVSGEVSSAQSLDRNRIKEATFP